ncbi:MAG: class B sortase [Butyrivibrio sp.]|nr:class B sortase [Butyrivibrio sp.]
MSGEVKEGSSKKKTIRAIQIIISVICIVVVVYEAIQIYRDQKAYEISGNEYDEIMEDLTGTDASSVESGSVKYVVTGDEEESGEGYPDLKINFKGLSAINEDYVGWIYFPALSISYPIVKEQQVDEYLTKTFKGTKNKAGCIFMDVVSSSNFDGYSDFVFGHNMRNLSMFGSLKKLYQSEENLLENNDYIYIYTKDYVFRYKVFAYYRTKYDSKTYDIIATDEEYDQFLKYIDSQNVYDCPEDIDFSEYPSILTLSTCAGASGGTTRFVVHTVKNKAWSISE